MSIHKRALKQVKGLIVSWDDKEPLIFQAGKIDGKVSHRNPVYRIKAAQVWADAVNWVFDRQTLKWLIRITVVFRYPNGREQLEEREIKGQCTIAGINDIAMEEIKDAMRHGSKDCYVTTKFFIECLGV